MSRNNDKQKPVLLQLLIMTSVIFVLLYGGWRMAAREFEDIVPIENVEIEGSFENLSLLEMKQKVASVLNGGYFTVDLQVIRKALLELPWVEDVSVRRQWPSALHINVSEKHPVAYWGDASMLSERGELFTPSVLNHDFDLPRLSGPEGLHKTVWNFLKKINDDFKRMDMTVNKLVMDGRRAWKLSVSTSNNEAVFDIKLGREKTNVRLDRFVRVFSNNEALDIKNIETVDLRYPNGFALRMKNKNITINNKAVLVREV